MVWQLIRANVSLYGWEPTLMISLFHLMACTVIDIANTMQLLGVSIDKDLNFNVYVKENVRKVSRKLQVLKRYKHLIPILIPRRGCISHKNLLFHRLVPLWQAKCWYNRELNEYILRFVFNDLNNSYEKLLQEINQPSLRVRRINDMVVLLFLALTNAASSFISDLFTERQTSISLLRGKRRLVIPGVITTSYGLHSFRCHANKLWNLLPDNVRVSISLAAFKIALKTVQPHNECCSFCDQC